MTRQIPCDPLSIELAVTHRRLWWQIDEGDVIPQRWEISVDVPTTVDCPAESRHVADISIDQADFGGTQNLLDTLTLEDWALEFIAETILQPPDDDLHPDLDAQISDGPHRMLILRTITLTEPWRGHGLSGPLIASALGVLAPAARLAVCRISPADFGRGNDRLSAELASVRMGEMLKRIGFTIWRSLHVLDLTDPVLYAARSALFDRWAAPKWFGDDG